jgi:hypothetical protein
MDGLHISTHDKKKKYTKMQLAPGKEKKLWTFVICNDTAPKKKWGGKKERETYNWYYAIGPCSSNQAIDNPYRVHPSVCLSVCAFFFIQGNQSQEKREKK